MNLVLQAVVYVVTPFVMSSPSLQRQMHRSHFFVAGKRRDGVGSPAMLRHHSGGGTTTVAGAVVIVVVIVNDAVIVVGHSGFEQLLGHPVEQFFLLLLRPPVEGLAQLRYHVDHAVAV